MLVLTNVHTVSLLIPNLTKESDIVLFLWQEAHCMPNPSLHVPVDFWPDLPVFICYFVFSKDKIKLCLKYKLHVLNHQQEQGKQFKAYMVHRIQISLKRCALSLEGKMAAEDLGTLQIMGLRGPLI